MHYGKESKELNEKITLLNEEISCVEKLKEDVIINYNKLNENYNSERLEV